jgi:predicted dehydrogenase
VQREEEVSMPDSLSRRKFLQASAVAAGGLLSPGAHAIVLPPHPEAAPAKPMGAHDRLRFGIVGVGMEGSGVLSSAVSIPGAECVAAADLYDGRHTLAKEITGNPNLFTTRHYQELLDRKDIDCILAAVPDFWHKQVVVDACNAGKDIYCEKPMSHTIAEGFAMVQAAESNKRIVQIGAQRVSSVLCAKARELYLGGAIGEVTSVELTLGRNSPNGAWEYPPPTNLSPENLAWDTWLKDTPKIAFSPERFARWRCWREYGTGVAGDLMVHLVSGMLFTLDWNEPPRSALSLGGIFRWKDGRDMPDLQTVLFDYHGIPVYIRLGQSTETPETARYMGPKGVIEATEHGIHYSPQAGIDTAPSYYDSSFPEAMRAEYVRAWHEKNDPAMVKKPLAEQTVYTGDSWDDLGPHLSTFFEAVKSRKPNVENAVFGNHAAIACHMANQSYFRKERVFFDDATHDLKS